MGYHIACWRIRRRFRDIIRPIKFAWQRVYRGYDDSAIWDLGYYLSRIAAPVLKQMGDHSYGYPCRITATEWTGYLRQMACAMELIAADKVTYSDAEEAAIESGIKLLGEWYRDLWT
jgi:hypothetical protein